jgi:hypothetical protein
MPYDLRVDKLIETSAINRFEVVNEITNFPEKITGVQKLAQLVEKILLTTPGSHAMNREMGGGLNKVLQAQIDPNDLSSTQATITTIIGATSSQIIQFQSVDDVLPLDEQLRDLRLVSVQFVGNERLEIRILVTSRAGNSALSVLAA